MDYTEFKLEVRITSSSILQGVEREREEIWFIRSARWRGFWMCRHQRCGIMTKKGCFRSWSVLPAQTAFCRNPPWRALQSMIPLIRLKKLIAVTGFAVRIWIWLLSQQKSVEFHARLIFLCMENCRKEQDFDEWRGRGLSLLLRIYTTKAPFPKKQGKDAFCTYREFEKSLM